MPIVQKFGLGLNLKKRNPEKALPDFVMSGLRFLRKGDDYTKSETAKEKNRISDECAKQLKEKLNK